MTYTKTIERASGKCGLCAISKARLRLALRCLSGAAEAMPRLFQSDAWMTAQTNVATLLGERAELPGRRGQK